MATIRLDFGILEGDKVRYLAEFIGNRFFTQRKSYDEYYVENGPFEAELDLALLQLISQRLTVTVEYDEVIISD